MKTRPNMRNATLERFDRDIRGHKFKNFMGKMTQNFASLRFSWVSNEVTYRFF